MHGVASLGLLLLLAPVGAHGQEGPASAAPDQSLPEMLPDETSEPTDAASETTEVLAGSHVRRVRQRADGATVHDGPLALTLYQREFLQQQRQRSGVAVSDTAAALGLGAPGSSRLILRASPALTLINGRRMVASPMMGADGGDFADINQVPISLVERVELVTGTVSGLYGSDALSGVVNFVTRRDWNGFEVDVGGQATDTFAQHEEDLTVTVGVGTAAAGISAMGSYFTRQPLAATDSDFIGERSERLDSLLSNPGSYLQLPAGRAVVPDPACDLLRQDLGTGTEMRLQEFGRIPDSGDISGLDYIPQSRIEEALGELDSDPQDGLLLGREISTFCTGDFSRHHDLVLEERRLQGYATLWYELGEHVEAIGELGYYRNWNQNRTAPSFPVLASDERLFLPAVVGFDENDPNENVHRDIPVIAGFTGVGGTPQPQGFIGRTEGNYAGGRIQKRRSDVWRSVLGLQGDFTGAADSLLHGWDWELSGTYTTAEQVSRTPDVLTDALIAALNSCNAPTITERQEAGCYNPFLSSALNNAVVNPLGIAGQGGLAQARGYPASDSDADGLQDGGFICDPDDPSFPCPDGFDPANAGTVNTAAVIDAITGEAISQTKRTLFSLDAILRGGLVSLSGGDLSFAVGAQYRRETLSVDHDDVYNDNGYAFLFGGPDVSAPARDIFAGFGELRAPLLRGLELQAAGRFEHFARTGGALGALGAVTLRPFALGGAEPAEPLEWLLLRGGYSRGFRAPSLGQMYGVQTTMEEVDRQRSSHYVPFRKSGNPDLDFETVDTVSVGLQWDYRGVHVGLDGWLSKHEEVITTDNPRRLVVDCEARFQLAPDFEPCRQVVVSQTDRILYVDVAYDNLASVQSSGLDGTLGYTLDSERRGLGSFGTFFIGLRGSLLDSYEIDSLRALREFYRSGPSPAESGDVGDAGEPLQQRATFEAAGERNYDNFAPPLPKLRADLPLSWSYAGHQIAATAHYVSGYHDQSENTVEEIGAEEDIDSMLTVDLSYGISFGDENRNAKFSLGVINIADQAPPAVEGPLGYEVGLHDPRGRMVYARLSAQM